MMRFHHRLRQGLLGASGAGAALALIAASASQTAHAQPKPAAAPSACSAALTVAWPEGGSRIERASPLPAALVDGQMIPAHCDLYGIMHERKGVDGQDYAIRFHMRLPEAWNGRFVFQGGGGSNGEIGDALGRVAMVRGSAIPSAIMRGYAVVSQDSGHDNQRNSDPKRGGATAFGFDPQARAEYGHASLAPVARAAKAVIGAYYHRPIAHSYFLGCSKGGEEGMVFAQQHPEMFDGIMAAAPGFALPRAAVEETWEVQRLAQLLAKPVAFSTFHTALTDQDLSIASHAIAKACDALDGAVDGMVSNPAACTTARVRPQIEAKVCKAGQSDCLTRAKADALYDVMRGSRGRDGAPIYADWAWDPGIATPGWRIWKLGSADGKVPALNIVLGGASLHSVFIVPPVALQGDPQTLLDAQLRFDAAVDGRKIYATGAGFSTSPWQDVSAHSTDLSAFAAHGGRLIVPHGAADPVFSLRDTLAWWDGVNARAHGTASSFARVFPVPGMNHCAGGDATDQFDGLSVLEDWVEHGKAPASIPAKADPQSPWPDRTRPLCAWPTYARYTGHGSIEDGANFVCTAPGHGKA